MAKAKAAVRVRVLATIYVDGVAVPPGVVIELPPDVVEHYVSIGAVDPHPDAVRAVEG